MEGAADNIVSISQYPTHIRPKLSQFNLARYRFTLKVKSEILLPPYKGSTFHGSFGCALKTISPSYYDYFYSPTTKNNQKPKPFVLIPTLEDRLKYNPGSKLQFELILFGDAIAHFPICFAAFETLGQKMGFGTNRGRYLIEKVESITKHRSTLSIYEDSSWNVAQSSITAQDLADFQPIKQTNTITLTFQTRLRLKENNRLLREAPPFSLFLNRLIGRHHTLSTLYHHHPLLTREQRNQLLNDAKNIETKHTDTHWDDWARYSGRQKEWMNFGGLIGSITHIGDMSSFIPYLSLGEWTNVGGKTSFGLGKYEVSATTNILTA